MHLTKNVFKSKCGRKARVFQEEVILVRDHPHFWFPSDQGGRRKKEAKAKSFKRFKV